MGELATSHILPAAIRYQNLLANNIRGLKEAGLPESAYANQKQILDKISEHINKASDLVEKMIEARKVCNNMTDTRTKAIAYQSQVKDTFFDEIRYHVINSNFWLMIRNGIYQSTGKCCSYDELGSKRQDQLKFAFITRNTFFPNIFLIERFEYPLFNNSSVIFG